MTISQIFKLDKSQYELDFVDIDITGDHSLFLDPFFISTRVDSWSIETSDTIKSFFQHAINLIKTNNTARARSLFIHLEEPNETCLGMSKGVPRGNGMGKVNSQQIFDSLLTSKAVETGIVEDLEDTAIFIEGIGPDKISDATTNIIRKNLLDYTEGQCILWNIPLTPNIASGFYWDLSKKEWYQEHRSRLVIDGKPYLLVPKQAVTFYKEFISQQYYQHYVLNYLQNEHLINNTSLVKVRPLKRGFSEKYVTKKDIQEKDTPYSKEILREFTEKHPEIFQEFQEKKSNDMQPITNSDISDIELEDVITILKEKLTSIPPGGATASQYHTLCIGLLELLFYPHLDHPIKEREINEGRKRIDIHMDNSSKEGFFFDLVTIHQIISRYIFIECKNYSDDIENPELDQLAGRFSLNSSKFGFLICRKIKDKELLKQRCIDLWKQKNELIIVLTDVDIINWLDNVAKNPMIVLNDLVDKRREIISS